MSEPVRIIDIGRGPQIEGHRLTVLDVFYYIHRGHDFDYIQRAMRTLRRDEFDAVAAYVKDHYDELVKKDEAAEERIRRGVAEQKAKGLSHEIDHSVPVEVRAARLKEKMYRLMAKRAESNGGQSAH